MFERLNVLLAPEMRLLVRLFLLLGTFFLGVSGLTYADPSTGNGGDRAQVTAISTGHLQSGTIHTAGICISYPVQLSLKREKGKIDNTEEEDEDEDDELTSFPRFSAGNYFCTLFSQHNSLLQRHITKRSLFPGRFSFDPSRRYLLLQVIRV